YARGVGLDVIGRRTPALAAELRRRLEGTPGLRLLDHGSVLGGIVTVEVAGWEPDALKARLDDAGINSALSLRQFAQFDSSDKQVDWGVRLAPHYYNPVDEVDIVADVMRGLAAERQ